MKHEVIHGDCVEVMRSMDAESVDAIVTDPPYGLGFMGKQWDALPPGREVFEECLRVLKPGGHLLAFGGSRTYHRLAVAVEDAGFEIRDQIMWVYGSGFPKSLDVSKAIDRKRDDREDVLRVTGEIARLRDIAGLSNRDLDDAFGFAGMAGHWTTTKSQPTVPTVEQWAVLRDMLNPGEWLDAEVWRLNGRKGQPGEAWVEREVVGKYETDMGGLGGERLGTTGGDITAAATPAAQQWQGWGTALKPAHEPIVMARKPLPGTVAENVLKHNTGALNIDGSRFSENNRWPANLIHDGSEEATQNMGDAARYFYCAKASKRDRNEGLEEMPLLTGGEATNRADGSAGVNNPRAGAGRTGGNRNTHPTVKPTDLMRYLVRLVTPPGGTVLDPFAGSGSTGKAAGLEGFAFVGIEKEEEYVELARARIEHVG